MVSLVDKKIDSLLEFLGKCGDADIEAGVGSIQDQGGAALQAFREGIATAIEATAIEATAIEDRAYAKLTELKAGDIVEIDDGFECMIGENRKLVEECPQGLYVTCDRGKHFLCNEGDGYLRGFYHVKNK